MGPFVLASLQSCVIIVLVYALADRNTTRLARLVDEWSANAWHEPVRLAIVQQPRAGRPSSLGLRPVASS